MDKDSNTPLHLAIQNGYPLSMVELLSPKDASTEGAMSRYSSISFHHAAQYGYTRIVELLLEENSTLIEATDKDNNTPSDIAVWNDHTSIVELLLP